MRIFLAMFCLAALGGTIAQQQRGLTERYENKEMGYIVRYPADYELMRGADDATMVFASPADSELDIFRENLAVLVRSYDKLVSVEEARTALRQEMEAKGAKSTEAPQKAKLAGRDAYRMIWSLRLGGFDLTLVQLVTSVRGRVYVATYSFEVGREQRHRAAAAAMLDAFEITFK